MFYGEVLNEGHYISSMKAKAKANCKYLLYSYSQCSGILSDSDLLQLFSNK